MAEFHLLGDLYFPNQGNDGWIEAEPEENHVIPLDDDFTEQFPKEADPELEVEYLPPVALITNPNPDLSSKAQRLCGPEAWIDGVTNKANPARTKGSSLQQHE